MNNATTILGRVQGNARGTGTGNVSSISVTLNSSNNFPNAPTKGNYLILTYTGFSSTAARTITSITQSNVSWTATNAVVSAGSYGRSEIWIGAVAANAGTSITVNLSGVFGAGGGGGGVVNICEYSGLAGTVDQYKTASGAGGKSSSTGTTSSTTSANELLIGCTGAYITANAIQTQSNPTNGFTLLDGTDLSSKSGANHISNGYLERIVSSKSTYGSSVTLANPCSEYMGCIATFNTVI